VFAFMRHAEAGTIAVSDRARPLTSHGVSQSIAQAKWLSRFFSHSAVLVCSPYVRARQTADIVAEYVGCSIAIDAGIGADKTAADVVLVARAYAEQPFIIVSHLPIIAEALTAIVGGASLSLAMNPATVALCSWTHRSEYRAELVALVPSTVVSP